MVTGIRHCCLATGSTWLGASWLANSSTYETFIHYTLPVLTGARRKIRMTTDQKNNVVAGSTQEDIKVRYTAKTHTLGGRRGGVSRSDDGRLDVKFSAPGVPGTGTNPEQLFAAGWSACFISAMGIVANRMKVKLPSDVAIDAEIDLCNSDDVYFLRARLNVSLPGLEREVAQAIVDATHGETCAYSNATRGNIDVAVNVV
jgi:osmotically inducible protein OsmC